VWVRRVTNCLVSCRRSWGSWLLGVFYVSSVEACWVASLRPGSTVSSRPCGFTVHRSPTFSGRGSSSRELFVPFSVLLQPPAFRACRASRACRSSSLRRPPGLPESASLGVFALFATSVGAARTWAPAPPFGFFPGLPRLEPALADAPSSTFRTSSTVSSAPDLAGLFHPAAAFRISFSRGFSPHSKPCQFSLAVALVSFLRRACGLTRASPAAVDFRALLPE
jgi:hypothetical protein